LLQVVEQHKPLSSVAVAVAVAQELMVAAEEELEE
jgi:hypothetical protein